MVYITLSKTPKPQSRQETPRKPQPKSGSSQSNGRKISLFLKQWSDPTAAMLDLICHHLFQAQVVPFMETAFTQKALTSPTELVDITLQRAKPAWQGKSSQIKLHTRETIDSRNGLPRMVCPHHSNMPVFEHGAHKGLRTQQI